MEVITKPCKEGTRILIGSEKRSTIGLIVQKLREHDFEEVILPIIQDTNEYGKLEDENDRKQAIGLGSIGGWIPSDYVPMLTHIAELGKEDHKIFYVQEVFRNGPVGPATFKQFTQIGIHVVNPTRNYGADFKKMIMEIIHHCNPATLSINDFDMHETFNEQQFSITCSKLPENEQEVVGAGPYHVGVGMAIGIDRLLIAQGCC